MPGQDDLRRCMQASESESDSDMEVKQRKRSRSRSRSPEHHKKHKRHKHHHNHHKKRHKDKHHKAKRHLHGPQSPSLSITSPSISFSSTSFSPRSTSSTPRSAASPRSSSETHAAVLAAMNAAAASSPRTDPTMMLGPAISPGAALASRSLVRLSAAQGLATAREQILQRGAGYSERDLQLSHHGLSPRRVAPLGPPVSPRAAAASAAAASSPRGAQPASSPRHGPTLPPSGFCLNPAS